MAETRTPKTYRLPETTVRQIDEIAEYRGGLKHTTVVELAVDMLHDSVVRFSQRRAADRRRPAKPVT